MQLQRKTKRNQANEFLKMVNNPIFNTNATVRYSGIYQQKEETLSHHITDVSLLAYALTLKLNKFGEDLDKGLVLEKVLLHDLDEVLTGDIPRSTKYYSEEGLTAMQGVAVDAMTKLSSIIDGGEEIFEIWDSAKKGKEGLVLKLADMICVTRKVITEIGLLNNNYFLKVAYEVCNYLTELKDTFDYEPFCEESRDYIDKLLNGCIEVVTELLDHRQYEFDTYGICNNIFSKFEK